MAIFVLAVIITLVIIYAAIKSRKGLVVVDDEVVLGPDDKLEVDGEEEKGPKMKTAPKPVLPKKPETQPEPEPKHNNWLLYVACIAIVIGALLMWVLPDDKSKAESIQTPTADTVVAPKVQSIKSEPKANKPKQEVKKENKQETKPVSEQKPAKENITTLSNYELERLAMSGDVNAQYQLGKRWVNLKDSVNVVKGIKYLKLAVQNGSSEAKTTLRSVYAALQQSATNGSTTAGNILREQR